MYFKPVSPVSSAPCTRCGRLGASKKKKVLVHGFMQRAHPRLVGSSRENIILLYLYDININIINNIWNEKVTILYY